MSAFFLILKLLNLVLCVMYYNYFSLSLKWKKEPRSICRHFFSNDQIQHYVITLVLQLKPEEGVQIPTIADFILIEVIAWGLFDSGLIHNFCRQKLSVLICQQKNITGKSNTPYSFSSSSSEPPLAIWPRICKTEPAVERLSWERRPGEVEEEEDKISVPRGRHHHLL